MSKHFSDAFEKNHLCVYCGKNMLADPEVFMSAESDHLQPLSKGGLDELSNIVISCNNCNRLKGNYFPKHIPVTETAKIIGNVREYIMKKRAHKLKDFMSWTAQEQEQYYT